MNPAHASTRVPSSPAHPDARSGLLRVLVAGASGLIGHRLCLALRRRGHAVVGLSRRMPEDLLQAGVQFLRLDAATLTQDDLAPGLVALDERNRVAHGEGPRMAAPAPAIDVVVNAIGIFRETDQQRFDALHIRFPQLLFTTCAARGMRLGIQLSALGAEEAEAGSGTAYHLSKQAADEWLLAQPFPVVVAHPSLVFAPEGPSARLFLSLAAGPLLGLPGGGGQMLQPIHVDDAVAALCALVEQAGDPATPSGPAPAAGRIALVGPHPLSLRDYLQTLRGGLGLRPAWVLPLPPVLATVGAALLGRWPGSLLTPDSWRMLQQGNQADAGATTALLGRPPRPPQRFLDATPGALLWPLQWPWLDGLLRTSLAVVWLFTAWVCAFVFPEADSLQLLERTGVPADWQRPALYAAMAMDLVLGLLTLAAPVRHRARLWAAQAAAILFYTAVISWRLPEFWWHPYGPLSKNLPMLAVLAVLYLVDSRRPAWTR